MKYIYDWNLSPKTLKIGNKIELFDESLRDGIQSPSVKDPSINEKFDLICLMEDMGIDSADIGLPCASKKSYEHCLSICKFIQENKLKIKIACAGRTLVKDIEPMARLQQESGAAITAYTFLGTSPIRQLVENWDIASLKKSLEKSLGFANKEALDIAFVTEDTTRSDPKTLSSLFGYALDLGASRLVLCDTVGHADPIGVRNLVCFTKDLLKAKKAKAKLDWHGHDDRGLSLVNTLTAALYGCQRLHGTALGIGERVGNTALDHLIVNLKLLGHYDHNVSSLKKYIKLATKIFDVPIPYNYPVYGRDAFRTATGVHAAAVIKALKKDDQNLSDIIYSAVPATWFGERQKINIGPMSGASNVKHWLDCHNYKEDQELVKTILDFAKSKSVLLTDDEIEKAYRQAFISLPTSRVYTPNIIMI